MKPIIILVMAVFIAIFAYQAYWLTGLYGTMKNKVRSDVREAVRLSDYEEMLHRIALIRQEKDTPHGRLDVSVNVNDNRKKTTVSGKMHTKPKAEIGYETNVPYTNLSTMLRDSKDMMQFGLYMQQGIHSGIDDMADINVKYFDKLLTRKLDSLGLSRQHRLLLLDHYTEYRGKTPHRKTKILAAYGPANMTYTDTVQLTLNVCGSHTYEVYFPPYRMAIIQQMAGILTTSLFILVLLSLTFWYLIHILLKMKTLDGMKSDFTNNMTHELKTPVAVAYAANDAMLNFEVIKDREKTLKYLKISQEQLKRLSGLIEQILSMSMERRKTMKLDIEEVDILPVLQSLNAEEKLKADKPVEISLDVPSKMTVKTDRLHFAHIMSNLLDNAIKYSADKAEITVTAKQKDHKVEITVSDHGIGIDPDKQKYIFDKFYRVPHGNIQEVKGYGLGLYYVKNMMDKLQGSVTVKSEPGKGTAFKLIFNG